METNFVGKHGKLKKKGNELAEEKDGTTVKVVFEKLSISPSFMEVFGLMAYNMEEAC